MDFSPSVYEHAAFLIGRTPWEVSRDAGLMFEAHAAAYRQYRHRPVVVGIDIYNLEAEAYGGQIERAQDPGIPAITRPICRCAADLVALGPLDPARQGRLPMVIEVARRLARQFPEADIRVPLSGPFSIAVSLVGIETLLGDALADPDAVARALDALVDGQVGFCRAIQAAGLDIALFESAAAPPLLSPAMFRQVELPALRRLVRRTAEVVGHPVPCIMGGNTAPILDALLETGTGYVVCPAETDQRAFIEKIRDRTDVRVRANTVPWVLVHGSWDEIRAEVDRVVGLLAGRKNVCLGTGALPYETPPANVLRVKAYCESLEV